MNHARLVRSVAALLVGVLAATGTARAQLKTPRESPAAKTSLDVGTTTIEVSYHRPALRGRDVWKELGAGDVVWRLGANEATTISFSDPVTIAGQAVPAGTYALFAKVAAGKPAGDAPWTLLLNKNARQWGAYFHDARQDLLRFEVKPAAAPRREWFKIDLDPKGERAATVTIAWDTVALAFDVEVDVDRIVAQQIERTIARLEPEDWDTRLVIVKYWVGRKERLAEALALIEAAVAIEANFWTLEWNARTLHALGETEPALPLLERALRDAKGKTPQGYQDGLAKLLAEWQQE